MFIVFCGLLVIVPFIFLVLPLPVLRLTASLFGNNLAIKVGISIVVGILMAGYARLGSNIAIKYLIFDTSILSYVYEQDNFRVIAVIVGAISGVLLQFGIRLVSTAERISFSIGMLALLALSLFTGFIVTVPG